MNETIKTLLECLIPLIVTIVGLIIWLIKLFKRNKKLCEIANVMGAEHGMLLSKDKDNKYVIEMNPDLRSSLEDTYKRYRALDIDKK